MFIMGLLRAALSLSTLKEKEKLGARGLSSTAINMLPNLISSAEMVCSKNSFMPSSLIFAILTLWTLTVQYGMI